MRLDPSGAAPSREMWQCGRVFSALPVIALLFAAPPAEEVVSSVPQAPQEARQEAPGAYSQVQAQADLETLLTARGREYLDARARLEAAPRVVAPMVAASLAKTPATLGPAQRQRMLALLGAFGRPEDLRAFADQLRRDVAAAAPGQAITAAEPWRGLLQGQGAAAADLLGELAADRELDEGVRALLLADLVQVLPVERLPTFIQMVGTGPATMRQSLRQALTRRGREQAQERPALIAAVDSTLADTAASPRPALLGLRVALGGVDAAFIQRLIGLAEDPGAGFALRVAALRLLGKDSSTPATNSALLTLASANLGPNQRQDQASEILGWIALRALPEADASTLVVRLGLLEADAPRLAAAAFEVAPLSDDGSWLRPALDHPWPEVRRSALGRVTAPCSREMVKQMEKVAAPPEKSGDLDEAVARDALRALGRCGSEDAERALIRALKSKISEPLRRSEAARQLLLIGGPKGDAAVSKAIETLGDPSLVRRLVGAARVADDPSPALLSSLCQVSEDFPALRSAVAQTLGSIAPGTTCSLE